MIQLISRGPAETLELGKWLGRRLEPGMTVGLDGDLGMGKTWLAKGLVQGIGEYDETLVKSPAFNLVHEYPVPRVGGRTQDVIHIDFYRLDELTQTDALLFAEYFERPGAISLVEWAGKFLAELVSSYLSIQISLCPDGGDRCREIRVDLVGVGYEALLRKAEAYADADS